MERLGQCPLTISLTRLASSAYNRVVAAENMLLTGIQLAKLIRQKVLSFL